jgi:hypothetical protein
LAKNGIVDVDRLLAGFNPDNMMATIDKDGILKTVVTGHYGDGAVRTLSIGYSSPVLGTNPVASITAFTFTQSEVNNLAAFGPFMGKNIISGGINMVDDVAVAMYSVRESGQVLTVTYTTDYLHEIKSGAAGIWIDNSKVKGSGSAVNRTANGFVADPGSAGRTYVITENGHIYYYAGSEMTTLSTDGRYSGDESKPGIQTSDLYLQKGDIVNCYAFGSNDVKTWVLENNSTWSPANVFSAPDGTSYAGVLSNPEEFYKNPGKAAARYDRLLVLDPSQKVAKTITDSLNIELINDGSTAFFASWAGKGKAFELMASQNGEPPVAMVIGQQYSIMINGEKTLFVWSEIRDPQSNTVLGMGLVSVDPNATFEGSGYVTREVDGRTVEESATLQYSISSIIFNSASISLSLNGIGHLGDGESFSLGSPAR